MSIRIEKKAASASALLPEGAGFIWRAQKKTTHVQLLETIVILVSGKPSREEKIEVAFGDNNGWRDQQTAQILDKFNRGTWGIRDACSS